MDAENVFLQIVQYYSTIKINELFVGNLWIYLEIILLSEIGT